MSAIQPNILVWARETAGLSLDDAAQALHLTPTRGRTGPQRLKEMEVGEEEPTRPIITKMAKIYRRPLLAFYLAEPPRQGDRGQDFRTLPDAERYNPELDALVRDVKARQGLIKSMLEDDEAQLLDFIGSVSMDVPAPTLAVRMVERLHFNLARFRATKTPDEAFAYLREVVEESGVYILLVGNLGSFHTNIPVDLFRGFALADPIAPVIVINDQDAKTAWSFTALHELVHLWLGQTGISGNDAENRIERYCNDVAGEFLLPTEDLRGFKPSPHRTMQQLAEDVARFAEAHRVSRAMVVYKLYRTGKIPKTTWAELDRHFREEWRAYKQREADKNKKKEGGPNYYIVRRHRMGTALLGLVRRSLDEGTITYTKASRVLGVKPRNVELLLRTGGAR
jgi:Zn-dependent peptidase ImmA (M78 family)